MRFSELYEAVGYSDLGFTTETLEKYKEQLEYYFNKRDYIYRGMKSTSPIVYADGNMMERKSKNTENYYTLITQILPSWKGWPARNKSFICSSSLHGAGGYGIVYLVIPLENQAIGQVSSKDFWNHIDFSEHGLTFDYLPDFIWAFKGLNKILGKYGIGAIPETVGDMQIYLRELNTVLQSLDDAKFNHEDLPDIIEQDGRELARFFIENGGVLPALNKLFDPKTNGCTLYPHYSDYVDPNKSRELWLSGKVLMINQEQIPQVMEFLGKSMNNFYKDES